MRNSLPATPPYLSATFCWVLLIVGTMGTPVSAQSPTSQPLETGLAIVYSADLEGRMTASGDRYAASLFTAAHRTLPMNSAVRVVHNETGASVIVTINDRGPFAAGRVIELSHAAAEALGMGGEQAHVSLYRASAGESSPNTIDTQAPVVGTPTIAPTAPTNDTTPTSTTTSQAPSEQEDRVEGSVRRVQPADNQIRYALQLGSFVEEQRAQQLVESLPDAWMVPIRVEGVLYHRVFLGLFDSQEAAARALSALNQPGVQAFVKSVEPAYQVYRD